MRMSENAHRIIWKGPFALCGDQAPVLFDCDEGQQSGLYLWGIPFEDGFLVNYVGETGRSFRDRHIEHVQWWLAGFYCTYDATKFKQGEKVRVREGIGNPKTPGNMSRLIGRYAAAAQTTAEFLHSLRIMVAEFAGSPRIRRRVEGAIYRSIKGAGRPEVKAFLDKSRYWSRSDAESEFSVLIESPLPIHGLADQVIA